LSRVLGNMNVFLVHSNYIYYPHKKYLFPHLIHFLALIGLKYLKKL
jgi:hypothetical protein